MTFPDVIPYLKAGESVIRKKWINYTGITDRDRVAIAVRPDGTVTNVFGWWCTIEDLTATDWEIHVPEPGMSEHTITPREGGASNEL